MFVRTSRARRQLRLQRSQVDMGRFPRHDERSRKFGAKPEGVQVQQPCCIASCVELHRTEASKYRELAVAGLECPQALNSIKFCAPSAPCVGGKLDAPLQRSSLKRLTQRRNAQEVGPLNCVSDEAFVEGADACHSSIGWMFIVLTRRCTDEPLHDQTEDACVNVQMRRSR